MPGRHPRSLPLQYLHSKDTLHRDLKTENLLLDARCNVKITDFGVARMQGPPAEMTGMCGSVGWMAPEVGDLLSVPSLLEVAELLF